MRFRHKSWIANEDGATAIEYGMITIAIAVGITAIVFTMGDDLTTVFQRAVTLVESVL